MKRIELMKVRGGARRPRARMHIFGNGAQACSVIARAPCRKRTSGSIAMNSSSSKI